MTMTFDEGFFDHGGRLQCGSGGRVTFGVILLASTRRSYPFPCFVYILVVSHLLWNTKWEG